MLDIDADSNGSSEVVVLEFEQQMRNTSKRRSEVVRGGKLIERCRSTRPRVTRVAELERLCCCSCWPAAVYLTSV